MKYLYLIFAGIIFLLPTACNSEKTAGVSLEEGFRNPPEDLRVGCYWYWIDKTITKEGVIADLQAMKQAGITRAFIGMTGGGDKLEFMSDEWWDLIHTTLKTASELDIEIGMFNCPGWSQSGGPWIKPSQTMRYLAAVQRRVTGGTHVVVYKLKDIIRASKGTVQRRAEGGRQVVEKMNIEQKDIPDVSVLGWSNEAYQATPADFQDVKVLAFPIDRAAFFNLFETEKSEPLFSDNIQKIELTDRTKAWEQRSIQFYEKLHLPENQESSVILKLPSPESAQSLMIDLHGKFRADVELQCEQNNHFVTLDTFSVDRSVDGLMRGFLPYSPAVVSFAETRSDTWKIIFRNASPDSYVTGLKLMQMPVVERYPEKTFAKMNNSFAPPWDAYMWDFQSSDTTYCIDKQKVIDITEHLAADGTLTWNAPEGSDWVLMRVGMLPTGLQNSPSPRGAMGLEVDKLNAELAEYHFDSYIGEILRRIPAHDRRTFKVVVLDSYEKGGQNFTDNFIEIFKQTYGYDPTTWLPSYYGYPIGSPALSNRFLWDMRRLVADRIAHKYIGTMRHKTNEKGLTTWLENYGTWGFAGEFLQYGGASDEVGGEFWTGDYLGEVECRAAASCAHTYGKQKVWAEAFTGDKFHYRQSPADLKRKGDWAFASGVNAFVLHVYIQQQADNQYPGVDEWYNTEFNRKNAWFSQMDLFTTYLRRCSFMLQQGLNVADVAYYIGEDTPKMDGIEQPKIPKGYNYDFINAEILENYASVKDGKLTLPHGTQYSVLVLPPQTAMRPKVLKKIVEFAEKGLPVLVNELPTMSPSLQDYPDADREVQNLAEKLKNCKHTFYQKRLEEVLYQIVPLSDLHICNLENIVEPVPVLFTHRKTKDEDIYFLTNQSDSTVEFLADFRIVDKQPELWDAVTGEMRDLNAWITADNKFTQIPLRLLPDESTFIVFRKKGETNHLAHLTDNFPEAQQIAEITSSWMLTFQSDSIHRGIDKQLQMNELTDLSENENPQIKFYSGTVFYQSKFQVSDLKSAENQYYLQFDSVAAMAKVKINGQYAGGVWCAPYRLNISNFIKNGDNDIEVELVTTWANRIIGDRKLPENERKLRTYWGPRADAPLQATGLMGKVQIIAQKND
ncbi:MAG: glycoside hydrolase family 2 [Dysgonamonadaceae bacterium]|nr:glycoside hydrolase family 2 [Dysgonamonadaceae bacterium]